MMYHYIVIQCKIMFTMVKSLIKTVISDVDGTLIYKGAHFNNVRFPIMLSKLSAKNISFAVATGRHYNELQKIFGKTLTDFSCICCDGAYAMQGSELIYSLPLPAITVKSFFETIAGTSICAEFFTADKAFLLGATSLQLSKEKARIGNVQTIHTLSELPENIYKIALYGNVKNFSAPEGAQICYNANGIAEYINRNASKYNAVSNILRTNNIFLSEVLYFGDGKNDAELLKNCGVSYTTYCADRSVFDLSKKHTRDVIGTLITLCNTGSITTQI